MIQEEVSLFNGINGRAQVRYGIEGSPENVTSIYDLVHLQLPSSALMAIRQMADRRYPMPDIKEVGLEAWEKCLLKRGSYFDECLGIAITNALANPDHEIFSCLDEIVDLTLFPLNILAIFLKECEEYLSGMLSVTPDPENDTDWKECCHQEFDPTINAIKQTIASKVSGYVYLLKSASGYWKIGRTVNPADRIKTFSVKLPFEVEYEHLIPCRDHIESEARLHHRFAEKRGNGEWFCLSAEDVAEIKAIDYM